MINESSATPRRFSRKKSQATLLVMFILGVYWAAIFYGTHMKLSATALPGNSDKLAHFCAFLGLGVLFMTLRATQGPFSWRSLFVRWSVLMGYALFDEWTQSLVGRDAEVGDWIADSCGSLTGLILIAMYCWRDLDLKRKPPVDSISPSQRDDRPNLESDVT